MHQVPLHPQPNDNLNQFLLGLTRARSPIAFFTPAEQQLEGNIAAVLNKLGQTSIPFNPENLNWMMQQIGATPDAVTAGFVAGRMIATEQVDRPLQIANNTSSQLANRYQIPINVPHPYAQSDESIYHFKIAFIQARSDFKSLSPEQQQIDQNISAILQRLGKISLPCTVENITGMMQQLGVTTPNPTFAGFVAGRMFTYQDASNAIERADNLLSGIYQRYGF